MRKLITVAMVAVALLSVTPGGAPAPADLGDVQGRGFFGALSCGVCAGAFATTSLMGYGYVWNTLMSARGGALGSACFSACFE